MKHHSEQGGDEIYLGNSTAEDFIKCGWQTKRQGITAVGADGSPLDAYSAAVLRPVFIKRSEIEAAIEHEDGYERDVLQRMLDTGRVARLGSIQRTNY